jgi:alginate O-acetyltransferase complex protein AlgI
MVFNSIHFFVFFAVVWTGCLLLRTRVGPRNLLLLAASYYFYGWWDWRFLGLLLASTAIDYICGRALGEMTPLTPRGRRARWLLTTSVIVNLGLLGFFKYYGFFVDSAASLLEHLGFAAHRSTLQIVLPVGISFYTFQSMSYVIDVYRGQMPPEKNPLRFALYVAFFPQLVAGPIERATTLLPQLAAPATISRPMLYSGAYLICSGLFKKVVMADNAAPVVEAMFSQGRPGGWAVLLGVCAFGLQVYCDFSGYSDIARGAARGLGFNLTRNFRQPFLATNPADFWQRWHVSLSTWLRDYLYFPLGGGRRGTVRTYFNVMVVMVLGGLWHGAAWTYVLWGTFHGAILCVHRAVRPLLERHINPQRPFARRAWRACRILFFMQVTAVGLLLFRSGSLRHIAAMLRGLRHWRMRDLSGNAEAVTAIVACGLLLMLVQAAKELTKDEYVLLRLPTPVRSFVYAGGILAFLAFGQYHGEPFIYFQF